MKTMREVIGKVVAVDGECMTISDETGGTRYIIHKMMPKIVETLCPPHLNESVVGMVVKYKINHKGQLVEMSPWPFSAGHIKLGYRNTKQ
jgi:hypothetical protein